MRILVDSDVFAYSCGFASQKTVMFEEGVPEIVAEPVENALSLCKTALTNIYNEVAEALLKSSGESCKNLELFLTGKDNFRDKVATIRPYKGNRLNKPKPVHYKAIRQYMVEVWGAKVVDGYEADDAVTMESYALKHDPDRVLIASVDKDLKTVPGLLYSFKKKELLLLTEEEARGNFYRQILEGDSSDNVVGCFRCGEKASAEMIKDDMDEKSQWEAVLCAYKDSVRHKKCPYTDPAAAAIETATLLHMLRSENDKWSPPV